MFGKNDEKYNKIDTLVGKATTIQGKLEGKGTFRVDGELIGDMFIDGNIIIGEEGKIKGNVSCDNIFISGDIHGNVICKDQLRITNSGKLYGDIEVKNFIVDENAIFEGSCKMIDNKNNNDNKSNNKNDSKKDNIQNNKESIKFD